MAAFKIDDWAAAFAYATPSIQTKFQNPQVFSQMVTQAYQPVYRPRGVEFRELKPSEFGPTQEVYVIGPDGFSYLAYYTMEKQPDGTWRINGCYLMRAPYRRKSHRRRLPLALRRAKGSAQSGLQGPRS
jgi:hypothetical protein